MGKITEKDEEVLIDLPKEWIELLNKMPKLKADWIEYKKENDDIIPDFFFTLYLDYVEKYADYKPFFTCIESGKEVFENFYKLYGSWYDKSDEERAKEIENAPQMQGLDDAQLKEIVIRYMEGVNYLLALDDEKTYDIEQMEIKRITKKEFEEKYEEDEIEEDIFDDIGSIMLYNILPEYEENPLVEMEEPLYQLLENYKNVYYILWPLGKRDDIENPFKAYVELWERHMEPYIIDENLIVIVE